MIKVVAPKMAQKLVDRAIQVHGGGGVSQDFHLAYAYARTRTHAHRRRTGRGARGGGGPAGAAQVPGPVAEAEVEFPLARGLSALASARLFAADTAGAQSLHQQALAVTRDL